MRQLPVPPGWQRTRFLLLAALLVLAAPVAAVNETWTTTGPFATGAGDRVITALAISPDDSILYAGTGSASVWSYTITFPLAPIASFTRSPASGNAPLAVQFNDTTTGSPLVWNWSFGDGNWFNTTDSSARNASWTYTVPGTYTASLTVANTGGSDSASRSVTVTAAPGLPTADFTGTPVYGTVPLAVVLTDGSDVLLGTMWNWSFGNGEWKNGTVSSGPSHTYTAAGTYTVTLTVANASGSSTRTRAGYVAAKPLVTPTPTPEPAATTTPSSGGSDSESGTGTGRQGSGDQETADVNVGGSTVITGATVTGTSVGDIVITAVSSDGSGSSLPSLPGRLVYTYLLITPLHYGTITGATISFTVPQSWLDENHVRPQDIVLYHYTGGQWIALPTTMVKSENGQVYFSATTPGFSWFAIGVAENPPAVSGTQQAGARPVQDLAAAATAEVITQAEKTAAIQPAGTTAAPAPAAAGPGFPLATLALVGAGCVLLAGAGWYVRRWWIRRQNPALFEDF